jgi:hypothetical protein
LEFDLLSAQSVLCWNVVQLKMDNILLGVVHDDCWSLGNVGMGEEAFDIPDEDPLETSERRPFHGLISRRWIWGVESKHPGDWGTKIW